MGKKGRLDEKNVLLFFTAGTGIEALVGAMMGGETLQPSLCKKRQDVKCIDGKMKRQKDE